MYAAILDYNKLQSGFFIGYVFIDIDRMCYYPVLKLTSIVNNFTNDNSRKTESLILYNANGHPICLNDYKDEYNFTKAFPTLFLLRDDGHLAKRNMIISLQV